MRGEGIMKKENKKLKSLQTIATKKKIFRLFLVVTLLISIFSFTVSASDTLLLHYSPTLTRSINTLPETRERLDYLHQIRNKNNRVTTTEISDRDDYTFEEILSILEDEGIHSVDIVGIRIPISSGSMGSFTWSMINLMFLATDILSLALSILRLVIQQRQRKYYTDVDYDQLRSRRRERQVKNRMLLMGLAIVLTVASFMLFIITEDISKLMILVNRWTSIHIVVMTLILMINALLFRRVKDKLSDGFNLENPWV